MTVGHIDERIKHCLRYLDENKYRYFPSLKVQAAVADNDYARVPDGLKWEDASLPYPYGREWTTWWFRMTARIPEEAAGQAVYLQITPNIDSLVYVNGAPAAATNYYHKRLRLTETARAGETFDIHVEVYASHKMPTGGDDDFVPFLHEDRQRLVVIMAYGPDCEGHGAWQDGYPLILSDARLVTRNNAFYDLYYDAFVLYDLASHLDEHSLRRHRILSGLHMALMRLHFTDAPDAQTVQALEARACLAPLLACRNGDTAPEFHMAGYGHLDTIWLWPFAEARRKMARTFSSMTRYMEEYPEFVYFQAQPCHLEEMATHYPAVFAKIKQAYGRGQWEPNGCSWVEMDVNLPGGESLIRQFVIGHQTTRRWLGYQGDTFWSPDTFGHSASLPQILRGCGVRFCVIGRLGNMGSSKFPYDVFRWQGLDGTAVETSILRSGYGGHNNPECLLRRWADIQQKAVTGT
ncbi:MAG: alpha-mannosidase, partial [Kiritimatiellae bacterium]|nr:alpha-mannosidase [Kiritimatiellia bacterium]